MKAYTVYMNVAENLGLIWFVWSCEAGKSWGCWLYSFLCWAVHLNEVVFTDQVSSWLLEM